MLRYYYLLCLMLLSGCNASPQKHDGIAPIGNVPGYPFENRSSLVKGEPGQTNISQAETSACIEYRGMMTAPMDPAAMKELKEKCDQSKSIDIKGK